MKISFQNLLSLTGIILIIVLVFQTIKIKQEIVELREENNTYKNYSGLFATLDKNLSEKEGWNEYVLKDCDTVSNLLNLKEDQLERLSDNNAEIHFKNSLKKYKIIFSTKIINKWTNCGFIVPVEVTDIHNIKSNNYDAIIFDKFITKRLGTASWIYLNDQKVKNEIFEALKGKNYDMKSE